MKCRVISASGLNRHYPDRIIVVSAASFLSPTPCLQSSLISLHRNSLFYFETSLVRKTQTPYEFHAAPPLPPPTTTTMSQRMSGFSKQAFFFFKLKKKIDQHLKLSFNDYQHTLKFAVMGILRKGS